MARVEAWLRDQGLAEVSLDGFTVRATGTAAQVSRALGVSLENFRSRSGHVGHVARTAPLVPQDLAGGQISSIIGLDTLSTLSPALATGGASPHASSIRPNADGFSPCSGATNAAAPGYYTLDSLGSAYGIGSLLGDGQNGRGETIGLFELGQASASDLSTYESCFGLTNNVVRDSIDGGASAGAGGTVEADLDVEQAATQAPGASLVSYEGPNTPQGAYDVWSAIVSDDAAQVVSTSWGECEPAAASDGTLGAFTTLFEQAASQGQTIFAASGDSGSEGCYNPPNDTSTEEEVFYPASDPWVTTVGGTDLLGPGAETAWNWCQTDESLACANSYGGQAASGGGMSRYEPRPSYQPNILYWPTAESCGQYCREVPDLASNAGVGMVVYVNGTWSGVGGTSAAAPFLAGLVADTDTGCTSLAGVWTPALYALWNQGSYGTAFNQITSGDTDMTGSNGGAYPATAGYNAATGLGSPIASGLSCPEVTSVGSGSDGSEVTVSGLGLEHATIYFGSTSAQVLSASATGATVVVPSGARSGPVSASGVMGTGRQTAEFTYVAPPPPGPPVAKGSLPAPVVGMASQPNGSGYWLVDAQGGVSAHGDAANYGSMAGQALNAPISHIVATADGKGYWLVAADGGTFAFGDAGFFGSMGGQHLNAPVVDIAPTRDDHGYWLVASDGGIFAFGDATFHGSMGGQPLNRPVVGISADYATGGYWELASDGGIFAFGAPFFGSTGNLVLNSPVNGMASTSNGQGYWFVAGDGGIFAFGNATFHGSAGNLALGAPIVGMAADLPSGGYWLVGSDGGVYAFGAPFFGSD